MVHVVPLSCCSRSWVLRAIRALKSVGSAIASSRALVCRLWVWPWVAAIASMQVRPTLLNTSCAVRLQPLVWQWVRRLRLLGFCGSKSRTSRAHSARAARILATSMKKFMPIAQKKLSRGANRSMSRPAATPGAEVLDAVGQRVGELEVGGRPGLLHVVAGDRDRVEPRHVLGGVAEDVADDPHARGRRVDVGVADHELLEDVVLDGPGELLGLDALLLGRGDVERHDRQHRAVHGHADAHLVERDAVEQRAGVVDRVDRHARPSRRRRAPAGGRSRSRGGWPGRRRRSAPSARPRGCAGRTRWTPRRSRSRRTGGSSRAAWCTSSGTARAGTA